MKLFDHQQNLIDRFPKKHLLCWGTGTGKTLTAIELANKANVPTFVVCPKALKTQWEEVLKKSCRVPVNVYTKENFKRDWNSIPAYMCPIVDEGHYFFGMKSAMSKSLIAYLKKHQCPYLYILTATPYRSTPWDVYRMLEIFGRKLNYFTFFHHFFYKVKMGMREIPMIKKSPEAEEKLISLIHSVGSTVKLEDCFDVPPQIFEKILVELTKEQKKAIESIDLVTPIERYGREHQICGGVTKENEYVPSESFDTNKIPVLMEYLKDNDKVIVVCKYRAEIMMLQQVFHKEMGDEKYIGVIHGDVKDRHGVLRTCDAKNKYVLLVVAQCSEGWELKGCPLMIFYSHDWALKNWIQMQGRIQRADALKKNTYISLVCKDTIDEAVYETVVIDKAGFHADIYAKGQLSTD